MAKKWPKITQNSPKNDPKLPKLAQKWPKMAQKLAPAEKNSTDISAASATFCISEFPSSVSHLDHDLLQTKQQVVVRMQAVQVGL